MHSNNSTAQYGIYKDSVAIVTRALEYIEYSNDFTLGTEQVAEAVGASKFYLCHIFKKRLGKTVSDYILEKRLSYADRLLFDGTLSVNDIALTVGYSSASYFIRRYKQYYGISPGQTKNTRATAGVRSTTECS